jgi:hypothetical protein
VCLYVAWPFVYCEHKAIVLAFGQEFKRQFVQYPARVNFSMKCHIGVSDSTRKTERMSKTLAVP